jgi:hypothetical protein
MSDWSSQPDYVVGDHIEVSFQRDWVAIWWDRVRQLRWDVPTTEARTFECISSAPGAIWPEVK